MLCACMSFSTLAFHDETKALRLCDPYLPLSVSLSITPFRPLCHRRSFVERGTMGHSTALGGPTSLYLSILTLLVFVSSTSESRREDLAIELSVVSSHKVGDIN